MAHRDFKKEDFVKDGDEYHIEFIKGSIGVGSNLIVEERNESGDYEVLQAQIRRHDDSIFVCWTEPFDGRLIYEE